MKKQFKHSAEGTSWSKKNHKYLRKEGNRYIYADDASSPRTMTSTPANLGKKSATDGIVVRKMTSTPANYGKNESSKITSYYDKMYGGRRGQIDETDNKASDGQSISNAVSAVSKKTTSNGSGIVSSTKGTTVISTPTSSGGTGVTSYRTYNGGVAKRPVTTSSFHRSTAGMRRRHTVTGNQGLTIHQMKELQARQALANSRSSSKSGTNSNTSETNTVNKGSFANNEVDKSNIRDVVNEDKYIASKITKKVSDKEAEADRKETKKKKKSKDLSSTKMKDLNWKTIGKTKTIVNNMFRSR